jgi:hypothetical protein
MIRTAGIIALLALASACKQTPKNDQATTATPPATSPAAAPVAKPEMYLYAVTVNNLLLRDQPTKNGSKVVTKFQAGDFVEGNGEVSPNREEVELRGIPYNEPYFRVTSTTPEQHQGWAYSAALTQVYAGPRATSPDLGKLVQFTTLLRGLNPKDLSTGKKAWDHVTANFADAKGPLADAAYILLDDYLTQTEVNSDGYKQLEVIQWTEADYEAIYKNNFDMKKHPVTQKMAESGFTLETAEGMVFPTADWQRMYQFFGGKVTAPFKAFLDQKQIEYRDPDSNDGGIAIELDELAQRAAFWEKFNLDNPYFAYGQQTRESEKWLRMTTLSGLNNTPVFNYETKEISPEYKKMWADVQQKYPNTQLAAKCKALSDLCAAEGWKATKRVEDMLTAIASEYQN